jgi:polysaccharide biosynthesis protein PslG
MRRRLWLTALLPIVVLLGATLLLIAPPEPLSRTPQAFLFDLTGEESLLPQIRGLLQWTLGWLRPLPNTAPLTAVAYTDLPPFGINTELEQEVEIEKRARSLQMIADAGFQWIRQPFPWYDIEIHGKGDFEDRRHEPARSAWEKYDNIVDLAEQHDLDIIARMGAPPDWSRHDGTARGAFGPPDDVDDFVDFAEAVVSRYRGRIRFYQIWNEPNIYPEWGNQPVDPEAYTDLLCRTYARLKVVDPEAVIISGAMAQTSELGSWNYDYQGDNLMDTVFLQRMYAAGAGACFDIMAVNNYMLRSGPTDHRMSQREINFSRPMWLRDLMIANGDAAKPLWISEMNSNAAPEPIPDRYGRVTLEQQARWAPFAFERIQREWPWTGVTTVWFFKKATDADQQDPSYYFRLVDPDFTPMPVYDALADYLTTLTPTLYRGVHQETSWQLAYSGAWDDVPDDDAILGSYRRTADPDAAVTLTWEGRVLTLVPGPGRGTLRITDAKGRSRDVALEGEPVTLHRALTAVPRRITLTWAAGELSLDAIEIR